MGRRLGAVFCVVGLIVAAAGHAVAPNAPALHDGVIPIDPYRWLSPPPGAAGDRQGTKVTIPVTDPSSSPILVIATPEEPPQAQLFVPPGGLVLPKGTRTLRTAITPVAPKAQPADGTIAGNVYRFSLTNQAGQAVSASASALASLVLRGPEGLEVATIERYAGGRWQHLKTSHAGFAATFVSPVTSFGDFALVVTGAAPSSAGSVGPPSASETEPSSPAATTSAVEPASGGAPLTTSTPSTGEAAESGVPLSSAGPPVILFAAAALVVAAAAIGWLAARRRRGW